jgi:protein O-GlcNAc transferase
MEGARENALAARPAPLQLSLVSYLGPMGADWIDYMLADSVVLPPERIEELPTEKYISLESPSFFVAGYASAFASSGSISALPLPSPEEAKLPNIKLLSAEGEELFIDLDENKDKEEGDDELEFGRILSEDDNEEDGGNRVKKPMEKVPPKPAKNKFIFCNFGQNFKIDSKLFDVWMRILKRVPNSVLWLLSLPEDSVENLETEALKRGVNPRTRLIFTPRVNKIAHLKRMARYADLFLDTPRFNGILPSSSSSSNLLPFSFFS